VIEQQGEEGARSRPVCSGSRAKACACLIETQRRLNPIGHDPPVQFAIAAGEVVMHFALAQGVVAQIIEAGVGKPRIERAQLREVKGIVLAVIKPSQETHQAPALARGRMLADRRLKDCKRRPGALHHGLNAVLERVDALKLLTTDDFLPGVIQPHGLGVIRDLEGDGDFLRHGEFRSGIEGVPFIS
jgi:hypothetical protein